MKILIRDILFSTRRPDPDKYQDYFFRKKAATYSKVFKIRIASIPHYVLAHYSKGKTSIKAQRKDHLLWSF